MLLLVFYITLSFIGCLSFEVLDYFFLIHASIVIQIRKDIPIYRSIFSTLGKFIKKLTIYKRITNALYIFIPDLLDRIIMVIIFPFIIIHVIIYNLSYTLKFFYVINERWL